MNKLFMGLVLQAFGIIIIMLREQNPVPVHKDTRTLIARWEEQSRQFTMENL